MRFILLFIVAIPVMAVPVPHAILTSDFGLISRYEDIEPALVDQYRADPSKSKKVEFYRLLVVPSKPTPSLQQIVEPAGTNINDGGFTLTPTNVTQVWRVRNLTAQEIVNQNANTAEGVSGELTERVRATHWEQGYLRLDYLQSEMLYYLLTATVRANLHTNLTVPERQRANTVSNNLMNIYKLWKQGQTNYNFVLTNNVVVLPPTNWPNVIVTE